MSLSINAMWTVIEAEDITGNLVPNVGLLVLNCIQCKGEAPCDSAFMVFNVFVFKWPCQR